MGLNGNVGNHNSGRKSKREEIEQAIGNITQDALIKLANSKVYKQLVKIREDNLSGFRDTKEMALPITLKGIIERKDITSLGEKITPIYGGKSIENEKSDNTG